MVVRARVCSTFIVVFWGVALASGLVLSGVAHAQSPAPTAGSILQQSSQPAALPRAPGEVIKLPAPQVQAQQSAASVPLKRLNIEGASLVPVQSLLELVQDLVGAHSTLGGLNQAAQRITQRYRAQGYALAYAYLPAQTITEGVARLVVVEPRYDQIVLKGASRLGPAQALQTLGVQTGSPVEQAALERGLLLLNQTPGVRVQGTLLPGAQPATSSLSLSLSDTPVLSASLSADNHGGSATGRSRMLLNASVNNPSGRGEQLAFNAMTSEQGLLHMGGFNLVSGDLRDGLRASASGSHTRYELGGAFAALAQNGTASQSGLALSYPLILTPARTLGLRLELGQSRFATSSTTIDKRSHTNTVRLTVSGARSDADGAGQVAGALSITAGRHSLDSAQAELDDAGPGTAGGFRVALLQLQREQPLAQSLPGLRLQLSASVQLASKNLEAAQKFYLGGAAGVANLPAAELGGDSGALVRVRLARALSSPWPGNLQGAVLLQSGVVRLNHSDFSGAATPNRQRASAAGLELVYQHSSALSAQLAYLQRIGAKPQSASEQRHAAWLSVRYDF